MVGVDREGGTFEGKFFSEVLKGDTCERAFFLTSTKAYSFFTEARYRPLFEKYVELKIDNQEGLVLDDDLVAGYDEYLLQPKEITIQGIKLSRCDFTLRKKTNKAGNRKKRLRDVSVVPLYKQDCEDTGREAGLGLVKRKAEGYVFKGNYYVRYDVFHYDVKRNNRPKKHAMRGTGLRVETNEGTHATHNPLCLMTQGVDPTMLTRDYYQVSRRWVSQLGKCEAFYLALQNRTAPSTIEDTPRVRIPTWNLGYGPHMLTYKCGALENHVYRHQGNPWTHGSGPSTAEFSDMHTQAIFTAQSDPNKGRGFLVVRCKPTGWDVRIRPQPECTTLFEKCDPRDCRGMKIHYTEEKDGYVDVPG